MPPSPQTQATTDTLRQIAGQGPEAAQVAMAFRQLAKWRVPALGNTTITPACSTALSGPSRDLGDDLGANEGCSSARLLWAFGTSVAPVIEQQIIALADPLAIDPGIAEGYSAVGLARDENPKSQALCQPLARLNNLGSLVETGGRPTHADPAIRARHPLVILCGIEGVDVDLLDPIASPGPTRADILADSQDGIRPSTTGLPAARFAATHNVTPLDRQIVTRQPQRIEGRPDPDRLTALWEWRSGPTPWLWMQHK